MSLIRDSGVVLMRLDYSETSQIVVYFTADHGKVRVIAKGIKRGTKARFAVGMDLLDVGRLVLSGGPDRRGGLSTLTEWKQTRGFPGLREKLNRVHAGEYLAEITSHLMEDWDPHPEVFEALITALGNVAEANDPVVPLVNYQWSLLDAIGLLPRFDGCVMCQRTEPLTYFSSREGGLICRNCEPVLVEKWNVEPETVKSLQQRASDANQTAVFRLLNYHVSHVMGRPSRLAERIAPAKPCGLS